MYKLVSTFLIKLTIVQLKFLFIAAEVSAQAVRLANLAGTVTEPGLASSLTGVVSAITDLSNSLAGLETLLTGTMITTTAAGTGTTTTTSTTRVKRRVKREIIGNYQKYLS